jgi:hypothetical protein
LADRPVGGLATSRRALFALLHRALNAPPVHDPSGAWPTYKVHDVDPQVINILKS